ncbi:hypothetical protein KAR91_68810, partial [Candidatus Pacearchaeota archaeon]|nr:hypothetical protein [Candidatus Pacearchaeota archaeon]
VEKSDIQYDLNSSNSIIKEERIGYSEPWSLSTSWVNGPIGTAFTTFIASGGSIATATAGIGTTSYASNLIPAISTGDIYLIDVSAYVSGGANMTLDVTDGGASSMTDEGPRAVSTGLKAYTINQTVAAPTIMLSSDGGTSSMEFTTRRIANANDHTNAAEFLMDFLTSYVTGNNFMDLTIDVVSTFLNNDALPTGAPSSIVTFMGSNPNGNYVTETSDNRLNNAMTGLLSFWFGTFGDSYKLSFNDIMEQLRDILQLYWFVDADDKLRFEHEKYFVKETDDSTAITVPYPGEVDKHMLRYEKGEISSVEQFKWPQASNVDFVGTDIVYNNFETTDKSITYTISQFTTDIKLIIDTIDDASDTGMGLYDCSVITGITGDDLYEVVISTGLITETAVSNAAFSWANLHNDYWTWSRMGEDATFNATAYTMDSAIRFLRQEGVRFFYSTAIPTRNKIDTDLTGGAPIQIRRDLDTDFVELVIGYDPYKL